jgi:phosphatidate cytidylyltransferase
LFSIITVFCLLEFYHLLITQKRTDPNLWRHSVGGLLLFGSMYLYAAGIFSPIVFSAYFLYIAFVFISGLYAKRQDFLTCTASVFLGQLYIALPLSLLNLLAFPITGTYYPGLILALFVFIWINDTGAYIVGSLFGKHRLFERISPKKSWEGFWGGLLFTLASSFLLARLAPAISLYHWIAISLIVVLFATWGDLIESLMKRTLQVKDSGNILPGHGGLLDRFDSLLLAVYGVLFYVQFFI